MTKKGLQDVDGFTGKARSSVFAGGMWTSRLGCQSWQ